MTEAPAIGGSWVEGFPRAECDGRGILRRISEEMKARSALAIAVALALVVCLSACGGSKKVGTGVVRQAGPAGLGDSEGSIRAARQSSPSFKIFPRQVSSIACQIPRGGPPPPPGRKALIPGTCATQLLAYHPPKGIRGGHGTIGIVEVAFTERWHYPAGSKRWYRSTYIVLVRNGHVLTRDTHNTGAAPPQSWI
jgi:hypothetical protein